MSTLTESNISNLQNSTYKDQFNLVKGGDKSNGFMENKYSFLNEPTTYGTFGLEEVSVNTMHPFNYMDKFKNNSKMQNMTNRRDNTLIINNYHSNEVGQYAKKKEEINNLFEPVVNLNAMAGDTKIVDKISLDRFSSTLKYKANEFPEETYVRAEQIDGTPMTEVVRPREKTLEETRGLGVNSIRLAPEGRSNETAGTIAGGVSTDPKSIKITTFKMKSYRNQDSIDDLLRTTGQVTRPEWRSMVKQSDSERSFMPSVDGPPVASVMRQEFHSDQSARPTNRTDYEDNIHITNMVNAVGGMPEYRSDQSARPTNRTEYEDNIHITNAVSAVGGREEFRNEQSLRPTNRTDYENNTNILNGASYIPSTEYRNEQSLRPTMRTDYENNTNILNAASYIPNSEYRNEQLANPTLRTDYENNTNILNAASYIPNSEYRNEQSAKPTYRTSYENNTNILNAASYIPNSEYRNEQSAKPTYRTSYENNTNILNAASYVPNSEYRNEQSAKPTYRTDYENNTNITNASSYVPSSEYRNEQSAKPTNRTEYENTKIVAAGFSNTVGYVYENNQAAKPTNRTEYEDIKFVAASFSNTVGHVYENDQAANPTQRDTDNEFIGIAFNQTNSQYKKYGDITRSGVVEEVLAKDYMGAEISFVSRQEDRTQAVNMIQNQAIEDSINLTKRDLMGGGTDRIPQGKDDIGEYSDRNRREKAPPITNRVRNVAVSYIQEVPDTRGYNLLQERSNINQYVPEILNQNPFISNVVHSSQGAKDIIRENTLISDREINRN
jgi:hypothetical protein